ncbi:MAG: AbrB/MazE/SpoVT family DNA-binding domain-containing protein [Anaerolineales bacterium]|nr:AbrB/MazE/SpoVT family DNA-binding domain-containing protein [Anaerolineales bacterium]
MTIHKVGKGGRVTIPKQIRARLGLEAGDHVVVTVSENRIILDPITKTLLDLRGSVEVSGPQDFNAIRKRVMADRAEKRKQND